MPSFSPTKFILLVLGLALLFGVYAWSRLQDTETMLAETQQKLAQLQAESERNIQDRQLALLKDNSPISIPIPTESPAISVPTSARGPSDTIQDNQSKTLTSFQGFGRMSAEFQVARMEQNFTLTDEEKQKLQDIFERHVNDWFRARGAQPCTEFEDKLKGLLGEDRFAQYQQDREQSRKRYLDDRRDTELAVLSRKLTLSPEQEAAVTRAIEDSHSQAMNQLITDPQIQEIRTENQGDGNVLDPGRAMQHGFRMRRQLRETENQLLVNQLRETLSDEQLNKLIQYQAEQSGTPAPMSPW